MIKDKKITLGCYVWANEKATSIPLMVHLCRHYSQFPLDVFHVTLNAHGTEGDNIELFEKVFLDNYPEVVIRKDTGIFSDLRKERFIWEAIRSSDIGIPIDCDEFISEELISVLPAFIESDFRAVAGMCTDRSAELGGKLYMKEVLPDISLKEQFPETRELRVPLKKIVAVKKGTAIKGGGHHKVKAGPSVILPGVTVPIDHYCWTDACLFNRKNHVNKDHYQKCQGDVLSSAIVKETS